MESLFTPFSFTIMNRRILLILLLLFSKAAFAQDKKESFSIIAFGDMPYFLPKDFTRFENLIKEVNNQAQAFNVHVGDIKSSNTPCTEDYYQKIYNYFEQFNKPLIYTPGDNEWTDCNKAAAGSYDPEERLDVIRKMFFKDKVSFGKEKLGMITQSESKAYAKFVENRRWDFNSVTFGTAHLVGTNNFFLPQSKNFNKEFFERDNANVAWLNEIFAHAKQANSVGVFIFTQADMFSPDKSASGCFDRFLHELRRLTVDYNKPVILVHGDSHKFIIDKPFLHDSSKKVLANFTRIQVFGEEDIQAVKIIINPAAKGLFQVEQLLVDEN
jgi:hypothetical protein